MRELAGALDEYARADPDGPIASRQTITGWRQRYKRSLRERAGLMQALRDTRYGFAPFGSRRYEEITALILDSARADLVAASRSVEENQ